MSDSVNTEDFVYKFEQVCDKSLLGDYINEEVNKQDNICPEMADNEVPLTENIFDWKMDDESMISDAATMQKMKSKVLDRNDPPHKPRSDIRQESMRDIMRVQRELDNILMKKSFEEERLCSIQNDIKRELEDLQRYRTQIKDIEDARGADDLDIEKLRDENKAMKVKLSRMGDNEETRLRQLENEYRQSIAEEKTKCETLERTLKANSERFERTEGELEKANGRLKSECQSNGDKIKELEENVESSRIESTLLKETVSRLERENKAFRHKTEKDEAAMALMISRGHDSSLLEANVHFLMEERGRMNDKLIKVNSVRERELERIQTLESTLGKKEDSIKSLVETISNNEREIIRLSQSNEGFKEEMELSRSHHQNQIYNIQIQNETENTNRWNAVNKYYEEVYSRYQVEVENRMKEAKEKLNIELQSKEATILQLSKEIALNRNKLEEEVARHASDRELLMREWETLIENEKNNGKAVIMELNGKIEDLERKLEDATKREVEKHVQLQNETKNQQKIISDLENKLGRKNREMELGIKRARKEAIEEVGNDISCTRANMEKINMEHNSTVSSLLDSLRRQETEIISLRSLLKESKPRGVTNQLNERELDELNTQCVRMSRVLNNMTHLGGPQLETSKVNIGTVSEHLRIIIARIEVLSDCRGKTSFGVKNGESKNLVKRLCHVSLNLINLMRVSMNKMSLFENTPSYSRALKELEFELYNIEMCYGGNGRHFRDFSLPINSKEVVDVLVDLRECVTEKKHEY